MFSIISIESSVKCGIMHTVYGIVIRITLGLSILYTVSLKRLRSTINKNGIFVFLYTVVFSKSVLESKFQ